MTASDLLPVLISYLIGAIPFGLIFSIGSGVDIRSRGSGNIGATNVGRLLGRKLGLLTLVADLGKGYLPMYATAYLTADSPQTTLIIALAGAAAVIGHMFPLYLGFKGGKGVATGLGVFLFLAPWGVLICLLVFLVTVGLSGFVSLGSLFGSLAVLPALFYLGEPEWKIALASLVVVLIWSKHHRNIGRLLKGTEQSWRKIP